MRLLHAPFPTCAFLSNQLAFHNTEPLTGGILPSEANFPLSVFSQYFVFSELPSKWSIKQCLHYSRAFLAQSFKFHIPLANLFKGLRIPQSSLS